MLIWYSAPEPSSGRSRRVRPVASVTMAPASSSRRTAAARSYGELLRTWPLPTRSNAARADGISAMSRGPGSRYASSWPVSTHMESKHAEPSSNVAPPTDEPSMRSPSTSTVMREGRPRNP